MPPSPSEEDRRRISRERATLLQERIRHTNRVRGLLFGQGVTNYNPLHKNRRECLEELRTGDGRSLPPHQDARTADNVATWPEFVETSLRIRSVRYLLVDAANEATSSYTFLTLAMSRTFSDREIVWQAALRYARRMIRARTMPSATLNGVAPVAAAQRSTSRVMAPMRATEASTASGWSSMVSWWKSMTPPAFAR